MKNVLIRDGKHMRPMLAVCRRYGVGQADKYDRGVWLSESDLSIIEKMMQEDPSRVTGVFNGKPWIAVKGTNIHNSVMLDDFTGLFQGR